jgi:hypothetical protein
MDNIHGHCVCGAVEIVLKEYENFVYACHCDNCRRQNCGPVLSIDPGPAENFAFVRGEDKITRFADEEVFRGFCSLCGTTLFWHKPSENHYCMNAELFDDVIENASFALELFYDQKPAYYSFAGKRRKLDHNFEEIAE